MPKVSIIIPVYNAEKYIGRCIESIINQEYTDFELLLINDGSKDSSKEIIDSYAEKDSRIRCIHKENGGVSSTRNRGLEEAKGEYIQFLDADDWISSEATKLLVRTAEEKQADLVIADFYRVVGDHLSQKGDIDTDEVMNVQEFGDHLMENPADFYYGVVWNKLYRTDIIRKNNIIMDPAVNFCEDFIFNLEYLTCLAEGGRIAALRVPVYYYVKTEGSLVTKSLNLRKIAETKVNVLKYYDSFFKNIHNEAEYRSRKMGIYSYLVEYAKDDPAFAFAPGTKKLGEESVPVYFAKGLENNAYAYNYYENKLMQRLLLAIERQTSFRENELKTMLFVALAGDGVTVRELASYLGISEAGAYILANELCMRKYLKAEKSPKDSDPKEKEITVYLLGESEETQKIVSELKTAVKDFETIKFSGFSEEEQELYRDFENRAAANFRRVLKDPNKA